MTTCRTSLGYRLKLVKSWIAYLNDPTKESPAEVIAENMLRTAQRDLIAAKGVNDRAPTDQSKADLSQCELKIELAGARVAIAKSLRNASPEEKLQWASMLEFELVYKFGTRSEVMLLADQRTTHLNRAMPPSPGFSDSPISHRSTSEPSLFGSQ